MIKDSGQRREFESGAVRDIAEGKGRCDLLPLDVVEVMVDCSPLIYIHYYIDTGEVNHLYSAMNLFIDKSYDGNRAHAALEASKHFEDGARKYGERNWEKGIPIHCYIDSAVRHLLKYLRRDKDEDHARAYLWNIMCAIWTHENKPECIDIEFRNQRGDAAE